MIRAGCDTSVLTTGKTWRDKIDMLRAAEDDDRVLVIISAISVFELLKLFYQRGRANEGRDIVQALHDNEGIEVVPISSLIAERAAGYAHGTGLPAADSLILATMVVSSCEVLLTRDRHFDVAAQQGIIKVEFL